MPTPRRSVALVTRSLSDNAICGVKEYNTIAGGAYGSYTADGITALCEGLNASALTALE